MEKKRIYCGWGRRNITPPQPSPLQGQFHVRIPTHTNDPLYATAFAVCTEGELPVVWCSVDIVEIVGSTLDEITAEIQKFISDFTRDRLIVGTIHTHTGPGLFANAMNECWGEAFEVETPEGCMPPDEYRVKFFVPLVASGVCRGDRKACALWRSFRTRSCCSRPSAPRHLPRRQLGYVRKHKRIRI